MDTSITRAEHEEFRKRLEEENERQNKRISMLEKSTQQISALVTSVEKLAVNMQGMRQEQEKQGTRLEKLEGRDGEMWRHALTAAATAIIGALIGYALRGGGF